MRTLLSTIDGWLAAGEPVALATVIATWGSAPRPVGAKMAVSGGGGVAGSVSGGCVEAAVIQAALDCLADGRPLRLGFGVADETAWGLGLACGGEIAVLVQPLDLAWYEPVRQRLQRDEPVALITVVDSGDPDFGRPVIADEGGALMPPALLSRSASVQAALREAVAAGKTAVHALPDREGEPVTVLIDVMRPPFQLVMVGAVHIAVTLVELAAALGLRTVVVDPRQAFATRDRFPRADRLVVDWPDQAFAAVGLTADTAVAVLSHDPKIDEPALVLALNSPAFYVGALGSRATQAARRERLLQQGVEAPQLARLRGPIGLDIGAHTAEEIALSILAEVVAARNAPPSASDGSRPATPRVRNAPTTAAAAADCP